MSNYSYGIDYNLFDAIVSTSGADYQLLSDAINAGHKRIFIKEGTYNESSTITLPDKSYIVGESRTGVRIDLGLSTNNITTPTSSRYNTGTVSVNSGAFIVTGSGTAFLANVSAGDYIILEGSPYYINSVDNDTQLTLKYQYFGQNISGYATWINTLTSHYIGNLTIERANVNLLVLDSVIDTVIENVNFEQSLVTHIEINESVNIWVNKCNSYYSSNQAINMVQSWDCFINECHVWNCSGDGIRANNVNNVNISNCILNNCIVGINVRNSDGSQINGCNINNANTNGIEVDLNNTTCNIYGCNVNNANSNGISLSGGSGCELNVSSCVVEGNSNTTYGIISFFVPMNINISGCIVKNCTTRGIAPAGYCTVSGCYVDNCLDGIHIQGGDNTITGNFVKSCTSNGIYLLSSDNTVVSNRCRQNGNGIRANAGANDNIIVANQTFNNTTGISDAGTGNVVANNK